MLNKINPSPYRIDSDPSKQPVEVSSLCFMDDTNLFATSSDALTIMLNFAQEFYNFNNTKINFSKAILICNRDPLNNEDPLPLSPLPYTVNVIDNNFDITPIPHNDSFRFLGVWFTLSLSTSYVKKQCLTEYRLFAAKLKSKRLTSDQLTYLHNMVLLPKVCYRLKATTLSKEECGRIMAPFKKTLKNSLSLAVTLPDSFIHSEHFINIVHLFHRSTIDKVTIIQNILSADNQYKPKLLLEHRLHTIKLDLNLQHSPLLSTNFSAFSKTNRFRTDFIFRLISFASKLGIAFAKPLPAPLDSDVTKHTPIYELFHDSPDVYAKNLYLFKKHNITHLSDCLSDDGLIILPFKDIIKKNSTHPPSAIIPIWYHTLINKTSVSERSLRLKDIFTATHLQFNLYSLTAPNDADTPLPITIPPQKPNAFS